MASKFKGENGIYIVKYKDAAGVWRKHSCGRSASAAEAEKIRKYYDALEFNDKHPVAVRAVSVPLEQDLSTFRDQILLRSEDGRTKARNTLRRERVVIDNFLRWANDTGRVQYDRMTDKTILEYFDHLAAREVSAKTKREERRVLHKFFRWSISEGHCTDNPVKDIPNPRRDAKRPRYFSDAELKEIFEHSAQPYLNIYRFLYLTGLRVGELGNLQWEDVFEDQALIHIRVMDGNKTKREETVPLSPAAMAVIREQRESMSSDDSKVYVFVNKAGNKIDNENVYRNLQRILNKRGIKNATTHTFRHTCASHLVIKGVSLYIVKEILRHASIKETEVYSHLSKEAVRGAIDILTA